MFTWCCVSDMVVEIHFLFFVVVSVVGVVTVVAAHAGEEGEADDCGNGDCRNDDDALHKK